MDLSEGAFSISALQQVSFTFAEMLNARNEVHPFASCCKAPPLLWNRCGASRVQAVDVHATLGGEVSCIRIWLGMRCLTAIAAVLLALAPTACSRAGEGA